LSALPNATPIRRLFAVELPPDRADGLTASQGSAQKNIKY
jgi:hypothetical protein